MKSVKKNNSTLQKKSNVKKTGVKSKSATVKSKSNTKFVAKAKPATKTTKSNTKSAIKTKSTVTTAKSNTKLVKQTDTKTQLIQTKPNGKITALKPKENEQYSKIQKQYAETKKVCKVTFTLPKRATILANKVCIVGDFNNWNNNANKMGMLKNGDFSTTLELTAGKEYQFRYLIDEYKWENDWNADKYVTNPFHGQNSVVVL